MKFPANFASNLNFSLEDSSLRNSIIILISVTVIGLSFSLLTFPDGRSSSLIEASLSESIMLSVSVQLRDFLVAAS